MFVSKRFPAGPGGGLPRIAKVVDDDLEALGELANQISGFGKMIQEDLDGKSARGGFGMGDSDELVDTLEDLKDQLWVLSRRSGAEREKFSAAEALRARSMTIAVALRPKLEPGKRRRRRSGLTALEAELRALALQLRGIEKALGGT